MGGTSWHDLQQMPIDVLALWLAFRAGEAETRKLQREKERQENSVRHV
jgi:hypothetical protein